MTSQTSNLNLAKLDLPLDAEQDKWLKSTIRDVPDFPKEGIVFKDLTTLLQDATALKFVLETLSNHSKKCKPDVIVGIEARGFILAPAVALALGVGFVPIRKPKKLPCKVERIEYALEYGTDTLEVHADALSHGKRVVIIDDLLATGGTAKAAYDLITKIGGTVAGMGFITELAFLEGRKILQDAAGKDTDVFALIQF